MVSFMDLMVHQVIFELGYLGWPGLALTVEDFDPVELR